MTAPRLAIVVPAYNAEPWIAECVRSIRTQTMSDFECVIVDDSSTDRTIAVANAATRADRYDLRFRIIRLPHRGVAPTINKGFLLTIAPWLMVCGADDILDPRYCEVLLAALDANPGARVAYTTVAEFGDGASGVWPVKPYARGMLATENCIPGVAIHSRALYEAAGGIPEDMPLGGEDWAYWLKAEQRGLLDPRPVWVRDPLYHYRRHAKSLTAQSILPNIAAICSRIAALARGQIFETQVPEGWLLEVGEPEPNALRAALSDFEQKHPRYFERSQKSVAAVIQILAQLLDDAIEQRDELQHAIDNERYPDD